jgi:hypothetical protein
MTWMGFVDADAVGFSRKGAQENAKMKTGTGAWDLSWGN